MIAAARNLVWKLQHLARLMLMMGELLRVISLRVRAHCRCHLYALPAACSAFERYR